MKLQAVAERQRLGAQFLTGGEPLAAVVQKSSAHAKIATGVVAASAPAFWLC